MYSIFTNGKKVQKVFSCCMYKVCKKASVESLQRTKLKSLQLFNIVPKTSQNSAYCKNQGCNGICLVQETRHIPWHTVQFTVQYAPSLKGLVFWQRFILLM